MVFSLLKLNIDVPDDAFNEIYPDRIRKLAKRHWTSVDVAKQASEYLAEIPGTRVLDIGSGVGKFCMIGACHTHGYFVGVEQRGDLIDVAETIADSRDMPNVKFIHSNINRIDFREYDAFYFFNSFHENIALYGQIDDIVQGDMQLFDLYTMYTFEQFHSLKPGTRLVTYCTAPDIIPSSFRLVYSLKSGLLKFWEKQL